MAQDGDKDKISKDALKSVDDFIKKSKEAKQNVQDMNSAFGNIATQLFGISGAAFFKEVPKTAAELKKANDEVVKFKRQLDEAFKGLGKDLKGEFKEVFDALEAGPKAFDKQPFDNALKELIKDSGVSVKSFNDLEKLEKQMSEHFDEHSDEFKKYKKLKEDFSASEKKVRDDNEKFYDNILEANGKFLADLTDQERKQKLMQIHQAGFNDLVNEGSEIIKDIALYSEIADDSIAQTAVDANSLRDGLAGAEQEAQNLNKSSFSFAKGIKETTKNFASGILPKMLEFDQAISDAGKNFGFVNMKSAQTSVKMAELGQGAARFNMSMGDAVSLMGSLGEELASINEVYLADAAEQFVAIEKATGISSDEIANMAGEMMRSGQSAEEVHDFVEDTNKFAKLYGVNSKKALSDISRNMDKMRQMGFQGGEESLARMVLTANRLRMDVDEIFDMASKARNIEGAMDMAAELQLAGGSFAAINPMDLLAAARKGPEELQGILKEMGSDIGTWNQETGEYEFDPIDVDRLQIMADATGVSLDSMQKMIQKNAEDAKKQDFLPELNFGEIMGPDGKPLDQDVMNNMINDSVDLDGNIIEGSMLDEAGISDLSQLNDESAKNAIKENLEKQKTLEEQAEANQSFQESITAFKDAIFNMFTVFEPVLKILTSFIQTINGMPAPIKGLVAALIGFTLIAPKLGMALQGFKAMAGGAKGLFSKVKGLFGKGSVEAGAAPEVPGSDSKDTAPQGKGETGLERLAKGLKAMGTDFGTVMKGVLATAVAGPALLLLLPAMPTLFLMAAVGAVGKLVEFGFRSLANGISYLGKAKGIYKGALALVVIGASMIPFAFALSLMADVGWDTVLMAIVMMTAGVIALMAIGALVTGPGGIALLMGALALVAVGIALMAFGASLLIFAIAAERMQGLEFGWLVDMGLAMMISMPMLILGGLLGAIAAPLLLLSAIGIAAIAAAGLLVSEVDWSSFSKMGDALLSVVPGLIGFGFAGLMFLNPILMLGMLMMIGTLAGLAMVMVPLAESLGPAADGLDRMAEGLEKLMSAANSLDLDKLEMLRNLSWSMAIAGAGGGIMGDSINKIAEALAKLTKMGEGGGKGGAQKIQIDLKLNGRDIQSIITSDTEIVT